MTGERKYNVIVNFFSCFKYDDKRIHSMLWNTFLGLDIIQSA